MSTSTEADRAVYRGYSRRRLWIAPITLMMLLATLAVIDGHTRRYACVLPFVAFALYFADSYLVKRRLELGPEGVTLVWLGLRRFVAYRSIKQVTARQVATSARDNKGRVTAFQEVTALVRFELENGRSIEFASGVHDVPTDEGRPEKSGPLLVSDDATREIVREVRDRLDRLASREPAPLERELERGGRTVAAWLADLAQLAGATAGSYRTAPPDAAALCAVLEDPGASPSARAGAAVVLRRLGPGEAERVRVVAEKCAAPRLRVALEAASRDDDAARRALERVERA